MYYIEQSKIKFNNKYDYSKSVYSSREDIITIICPEHGEFTQNVRRHYLSKTGCPKCGADHSKSVSVLGTNNFITKANKLHNNKYDYSKSNYVNHKTKITIICPEHGEFEQTPMNHTDSRNAIGCAKCAIDFRRRERTYTGFDFISISNHVHNNKYDYSLVDYVSDKVKVKIICPEHGIFQKRPNCHTQGHGCPRCSLKLSVSIGEIDLRNFIESNYNGEISYSNRKILNGKELDIYLPELSLAIEYNGLYWHSEKSKEKEYHYNKTISCKNKGIRLIHLWENEWFDSRIKVEYFLLGLLKNNNKILYARKLEIKKVSIGEQRNFINENHFQNYISSSVCLGLYNGNDLVQLMSLKKIVNKNYEIGRLCTKHGNAIVGGSLRLFKNLKKLVDWDSIISYNNLDKFTGETYEKLGMKYESHSHSLFFTNGKEMVSRYQFQRSKILPKTDVDSDLIKVINDMGYFRLFTSGNSKFIINK